MPVRSSATAAAPPAYQIATAEPPDQTADPLEWERPILYDQADLGGGRRLHVLNVHLKSKLATDIQGQKLDDYTWKNPAAWAEGFFISFMKRVGPRPCRSAWSWTGCSALLATLEHTEIHNEYLPDESGAFRTDVSSRV